MIVVVGGPFEKYSPAPGFDYWGAPSFGEMFGSLLDLSPQGAHREQTNVFARGNALFPIDVASITMVPAEYHVFGSGTDNLDAISMSGTDRAAFSSLFNVPVHDDWATLLNAVACALMDDSDPTESGDGTGSIEPARHGGSIDYDIAIHFGDDVYREAFRPDHRHVGKWIARQHKTLERVWSQHGPERAGKVLDYILTEAERASRRSVNEDAFIPASLRGQLVRGVAETTITDDFTSDSSSDYYIVENALAGHWDSGLWECDYNGGIYECQAHNTALSSADHYSQAYVDSVGASDRIWALAIRCDFTYSSTYYWAGPQYGSTANAYMFKRLGGSNTQLALAASSFAAGSTYKFDATGSDLEYLKDASSQLTATDSSITGNLNAGWTFYSNDGPSEVHMDNFEASDGAGGGAGGGGSGGGSGGSGQSRNVLNSSFKTLFGM